MEKFEDSYITSTIKSKLNTNDELDKFACGMNAEYHPNTLREYNQYRRFMHDIICLGLIASKFYNKENMRLIDFQIITDSQKLNDQKPDLYEVTIDEIRVCEVGVTVDYDTMYSNKRDKYNEFFELIQNKTGKMINYNLCIIDISDPEWEDTIPKIPESHLMMFKLFVDNLRIVHSTNKGAGFLKFSNHGKEFQFDFNCSYEQLSDELNSNCQIELGCTSQRLKAYCQAGKVDLTMQQDYLDKIANTVLESYKDRPYPHFGKMIPIEFESEWREEFMNRKENTEKLPVILQLGAPSKFEFVELSKKDLYLELLSKPTLIGGYMDHVREFMDRNASSDWDSWDGLMELYLSKEQHEYEMMQGPGRKKYLQSQGKKVERKPPTHIGINGKHTTLLLDLISQVRELNLESADLPYNDLPPIRTTGRALNKGIQMCIRSLHSDGTCHLLRFYQKLSTEIILNSMRRRGKKEYIFGSSGTKDVYFLVAPGAQLRTETSVIFIKLISYIDPLSNILSREWKSVLDDHYESDWISVDIDRLKHWSRCEDRVNLSLIGSAEKLVVPDNTLELSMNTEISRGNYALMGLIYLEDKSTTSTTIQSSRYIMMKSYGDRKFKGILSKFPSRINSIIQSHVMQQIRKFTLQVCSHKTHELLSMSDIKRDDSTGNIDETTAGVTGFVPRVFTFGEFVPIQYNINEVYWCMMYNKDRQNPTQDSMKILEKIQREEYKLNQEFLSRPVEKRLNHYFGDHSIDEDIAHLRNSKPESHYFSRRAVKIGMALQDLHKDNFAPRSGWLTTQKMYNILNKNLSEYATFKASVKTIRKYMNEFTDEELKEIGSRTKCIELVYELVSNEDLMTARDVVMQFDGVNGKNFETTIQIFKKNQIGGVREILILYIKARILINITEEICRLLSKSDKRETLTKGKDKRLMMRGDYEELSASFPEGTPILFIKNSYDMATWCQKFLPPIFMSIYQEHNENLGNLFGLCTFVMMKHCTKKIEFPRKLVEQWIKHEEIEHDKPWMQDLKSRFLETGSTHMVNFSNMGQGILHYNSTVLALSAQSLRDELFRRCLEILGQEQVIRWRTRVGSDDKGDLICLDLSKKNAHQQAVLLDQCSRAAEMLHSMDLSVKSASGTVIYEFNSAFMANLEVQSPIIKFTMAACDLIGTDSCTKYVNESYSRIRQLRENGASSLLCTIAHHYNKKNFNYIFKTSFGDVNDPRLILDDKEENIPYDFGIYPMYDSDLQDIVGPEYHNYKIMKTDPSSKILSSLYSSSVKLEDGVFTPDDDEGLFKKNLFSIRQGLTKQLENMKMRLSLTPEYIDSYLARNPFMIIRGPETIEETAIMIASKLFTRGAAESLRRTSPAIYLGRISAYASAKAWKLPEDFLVNELNEHYNVNLDVTTYKVYLEENDVDSRLTYRDFLLGLMKHSEAKDLTPFKILIFPQYQSFDAVSVYEGRFGLIRSQKRFFAQAVRTWTLNNYNYNFSSSLKQILETSFNINNTSSIEDVRELRKAVPFNLDSYDSFVDDCNKRGVKALDVFFYLTKFYKNSVIKKAQVFASGPSSSSLNLTLNNLKKYNHMVGNVVDIDVGLPNEILETEKTNFRSSEILKLGFNLSIIHKQDLIISDTGHAIQDVLEKTWIDNETVRSNCESILRSFQSLSGMDNQTKKICIMLASYLFDTKEFMSCLIRWKQLNFSYLQRQKKDLRGHWYGDLRVLVNYQQESYIINKTSGNSYIHTLYIENLDDFNQSLKSICHTMGLELTDFCIRQKVSPSDFVLQRNRVVQSLSSGISNYTMNIRFDKKFPYNKLQDLTNFKVVHKMNDDQSTSILLEEKDKRVAQICHYPGHYYPITLPSNLTIDDDVVISGVRACRLFENRYWFLDGRLPIMNESDTIEFILNDLNYEECLSVSTKSNSIIREYTERLNISDLNRLAEDYNMDSPVELENEEQRELREGDNLFEFFDKRMANLNLDESIFTIGETERFNADDYNDEVMLNFTTALGENKIRARRRDFYTISNLRTNLTFKNRILDLFFRHGDIMRENKKKLPDYMVYIGYMLQEDKYSYFKVILESLYEYICERVSTSTGRDVDSVRKTINKAIRNGRSSYLKLTRLDRVLNNEEMDLFDHLENPDNFQDAQASDTDNQNDPW
jgi:hypothetical protein